jgi:hypothetical protein
MKSQILKKEKEKWLILTPENEFEEEVLEMFEVFPNTWRGEFKECRGGFMRSWASEMEHKKDLIIKFENEKADETNQPNQR